MLELLIPLLVGILLGIITGLIPGLHTNLLSAFLVSISATLLGFLSPLQLVILIIAMGITNTFVDTIPAIYLGAPDEETALSALPGHKLLLEGRGHEAVVYTLIGSAIAIVIFILITPIFLIIVPKIQAFLEQMMSFFLISASVFLVLDEKDSKIKSLIIFILAGFLGIATLNLNIGQPLLPLLTGLFGTSTLIYSISCNSKIPKQIIGKMNISKRNILPPAIATAIVSPICSFLPGMGASQSAIISSKLIKDTKPNQFLILIGSTNTLVLAISFLTLFLVNKKRTGIASAISEIMKITSKELMIIILATIVVSIISIYITITLSKFFANKIDKLNYTTISKTIILSLIIAVLLISGWLGLLILLASTTLGLTCTYLNIRKGFLMGCLLIPTILFYLPF